MNEEQRGENKMQSVSKKTLVINAFGGPGAGKTTACLHIASELKKRGFVAEYVSEYAKELVWDKNFKMLDGSEEHQKMILSEQKKRIDRLIGQVDFVVTDAPVLLNSVYLDLDNKESYDQALVELFNKYDNFNLEIVRDVSSFEQEGRIHNLEQSQQADNDIRCLLNQNGMLRRQVNDITEGIMALDGQQGTQFTVKRLESTKKSLMTRLKKLADVEKRDDVVTFEELGVDRLFVDEAHEFKNLFLYTKMRNVAGIGQVEAEKSSDLYNKCQYLDEITDGKGSIFATGTPVAGLQQLNAKFNFDSVFVGNPHNLDHRRGNLALFFKR